MKKGGGEKNCGERIMEKVNARQVGEEKKEKKNKVKRNLLYPRPNRRGVI